MSFFNLEASLERLKGGHSQRKRRSDRGQSRLSAPVKEALDALLTSEDKPSVRELMTSLRKLCADRGERCPSRSTVYQYFTHADAGVLLVGELPAPVRATLFNIGDVQEVPAVQVAFHCFNYGDVAALSYAAAMPWLALYQVSRLRGFRPKSKSLLDAVLFTRGI